MGVCKYQAYQELWSSYHLYAKNVQLLQPTCEAQVNTLCFQAPQTTLQSTKIVTGHAIIQPLGRDSKAGSPHQPLKPIHLTNLYIVTGNTKTYLRDIPLSFNFILLLSQSKVLSSIPCIFPHLLITTISIESYQYVTFYFAVTLFIHL